MEHKILNMKDVDLEFVYEEVLPAGMDGSEAEEMEKFEKHLAKIIIKRKGKIIKVIEPMLYNVEYIQGNEPEDEFGTLNVYSPDEKELQKLEHNRR